MSSSFVSPPVPPCQRPFTQDEIKELLFHFLLRPEFCALALEHLRPCLFTGSEKALAAVVHVAHDLLDGHDVAIMRARWLPRLEAAARAFIRENDDGNGEYALAELFGDSAAEAEDSERETNLYREYMLDDLDESEYDEADSSPVMSDEEPDSARRGPFFVELRHVAPAELKDEDGRELLRRFLRERMVLADLQEQVEYAAETLDLDGLLAEKNKQLQAIDTLCSPQAGNFEDELDAYVDRQNRYRGRQIIGLRTGMVDLDTHLLGVRGLTILAASPNAGKTALALDLGIGVARHHEENDAVVIIVSLDMGRDEVFDRVLCNVAEIDWQLWKFGSLAARGRSAGPWFDPEDQHAVDRGMRRLRDQQITRRILVHDATTLGPNVSAQRLAALGHAFKSRIGAHRALFVIDYLQLLPIPFEIERLAGSSADQYRVAVAKDLVRLTRTADNPDGDAVIAISEARKPSKASDFWGVELSEVLGSVRGTYCPDCVLTCWPMSKKKVEEVYEVSATQAEMGLEELGRRGIAPLMVGIKKGRDGMQKGAWPMEFRYHQLRFSSELTALGELIGGEDNSRPPIPAIPDERDAQRPDATEDDCAAEDMLEQVCSSSVAEMLHRNSARLSSRPRSAQHRLPR
jgi:hypothetical protein